MEENSNQMSNKMGTIPTGSGEPGSGGMIKSKKVIIGLVIIGLLLILSLVLLFIISQKNTKKEDNISSDELIEQNVRLSKFYGREQTVVDDPKIIDARFQILEYAKKNNISVTDEEVENRKNELIEASGQDAISKTLESYGWTDDDWTEVIKGKLLHEKIIANIKPSRSGEVLSVRWDVYSPELNQEIANQRKVPATEFLNKIKAGVEDGSIKDLYTIHQNFDIATEPIFEGLENNYALQYSGWDDASKTYKEFLATPGNVSYETIMATSPPEVTEVVCTLGGCQIYNITSGTNGDPEGDLILQLIQENNIQF